MAARVRAALNVVRNRVTTASAGKPARRMVINVLPMRNVVRKPVTTACADKSPCVRQTVRVVFKIMTAARWFA
jgi:hypothetical protein